MELTGSDLGLHLCVPTSAYPSCASEIIYSSFWTWLTLLARPSDGVLRLRQIRSCFDSHVSER